MHEWVSKHIGTLTPEFQKGAIANKQQFLLPQVNNILQAYDCLPMNILKVGQQLHTMAEKLDIVYFQTNWLTSRGNHQFRDRRRWQTNYVKAAESE